jgi:hypothetical protein
MRKFSGPIGLVSRLTIESQALRSNMLGDPSTRAVDVYTRPATTDNDFPCSWILSASRVAACLKRIGSASARTCRSGSTKVVNALAMAATYDPDPMQFLGIRLPVTFDTCEVIEERWANWMRQDPVVAIETQADNLRRLKALYIDCGEKDQFNLLYGARRFVRRLNEFGIAHRYEEFPTTMPASTTDDERLPLLAEALSG